MDYLPDILHQGIYLSRMELLLFPHQSITQKFRPGQLQLSHDLL
jgi:hypothetical protein